jgi:hypothetical protein
MKSYSKLQMFVSDNLSQVIYTNTYDCCQTRIIYVSVSCIAAVKIVYSIFLNKFLPKVVVVFPLSTTTGKSAQFVRRFHPNFGKCCVVAGQ